MVNDLQLPLIRELEKRDVTVAPLPMRHARTLSGGFHCVSLDCAAPERSRTTADASRGRERTGR